MGWSSQFFTTIIIEGNTPQTGIFIYNGTPALGTLIGAWAAQGGTDAFGNTYVTGINVNQGNMTGINITQSTATVMSILASTISNSVINGSAFNQGQINETTIIFDSGGGVLFGYTSTTTTVSQSVSGNYTFISPLTGTASVFCIGAAQGGDGGSASVGGGGGNAGECAGEPSYPIINAQHYPYTVGNGGAGNSTGGGNGQDGGDTFFDNGGSAGGVFANAGGASGPGTGSTNSVHFDGGTGGAQSAFKGGASGGNSGNKTAKGNNGLSSVSNTHAGAPVPQSGSGTGGAGGDNAGNGSNGGSPGAGGGGAGAGGSNPINQSISYAPIWNASYFGPDANGGAPPNGRRSTSTMYQGGETASGGAFNGNQRSVFGFNRTQIASDFSGFTITGCQVQFKNLHSWYNSGMIIELDEFQGLPGTAPGSMPTGDFVSADAALNIAEGATTIFNISTSIANRFVTGASNGLGMGFNLAADHPYNLGYYGYFDPSQTRFKITGTSGGAGITTAGNGADGNVTIIYATASVLEMALTPIAGSDVNGNAYAAGYTGPVNVFTPGVSPTTVETWHLASITLAGWANQAGGTNLQYKLLPGNELHIVGELACSVAGGGTLFTLPVGWRPVNTHFITLWQSTGAIAGNDHVQIIAGTGVVNITNPGTTGTFFVNGIVPMDGI